jgi:hypothetical protein
MEEFATGVEEILLPAVQEAMVSNLFFPMFEPLVEGVVLVGY